MGEINLPDEINRPTREDLMYAARQKERAKMIVKSGMITNDWQIVLDVLDKWDKERREFEKSFAFTGKDPVWDSMTIPAMGTYEGAFAFLKTLEDAGSEIEYNSDAPAQSKIRLKQ